jgi:flagellar hook-basal body complex protein FliE
MTIPLSGISGIGSIPLPSVNSGSSASSNAFSGVLNDAMSTISNLQKDADTNVSKFLSGENDDLHTTILATQRAEMAFELGLQIRNKVVNAYQEVMKMQL